MSVSKLNFNDNNEAYIIVEPISDINKVDFKNFLDLDSPSFLKCEFENGKAFTLYYSYGNRITLKQFLSRVVEKSEAVNFLKSLTKAYMEAEKYGLNTDHILLGINSIFYNEESQKVSCVYIPAREGVLPARPLRLFLKEMLVNIVYSEEDDMTWLGNTIRYISRNRQLSYNDFYDFLQTQEELDQKPAAEADVIPEAEPELKFEIQETEKTEKEISEEGTQVVKEKEPVILPDVKTVPLQRGESEEDLSELKSVLESIPAAESVNALKFSLQEDEAKSAEIETVEAGPEEIQAAAETEPEAAMSENIENRMTGLLLRRKNQMSYVLEKAEMSIGKSESNDIYIGDNPAISRVHAIIRRADDNYFIRDNASTNHSFVNGIVLVEDQEKALSAGDRILLGNEEFIFKLQEK